MKRGGPATDDRRLVRALLAGRQSAFEEFFEGHFRRLYRFALPRVDHDVALAEEVVQCSLIRALDKLSSYRGEASLFAWLCTFCRHEISDHFRRHPSSSPLELVEEAPEVRAALESLGSVDTGPERDLRRKELSRLVQVALDHLPRRYGSALTWKYLEGLPVREIAQRLQVSPKAAESVLTRARQAFRDGFGALYREAFGMAAGAELRGDLNAEGLR